MQLVTELTMQLPLLWLLILEFGETSSEELETGLGSPWNYVSFPGKSSQERGQRKHSLTASLESGGLALWLTANSCLSLLLTTSLPADLFPYSSPSTATRHFSGEIFLFSSNICTQRPLATIVWSSFAVRSSLQESVQDGTAMLPQPLWHCFISPWILRKGTRSVNVCRWNQSGWGDWYPRGLCCHAEGPQKAGETGKRNLMKFSKELHLERNSLTHRGVTGRRVVLQEKGPNGIGINNRQGIGASGKQGENERARTAQPGKEKAQLPDGRE